MKTVQMSEREFNKRYSIEVISMVGLVEGVLPLQLYHENIKLENINEIKLNANYMIVCVYDDNGGNVFSFTNSDDAENEIRFRFNLPIKPITHSEYEKTKGEK